MTGLPVVAFSTQQRALAITVYERPLVGIMMARFRFARWTVSKNAVLRQSWGNQIYALTNETGIWRTDVGSGVHIFVTVIRVSYLSFIITGTLGATVSLWFFLRANRRLKFGFCPKCDYDLRHSPDRCPECGTPILPAR